MPAWAVQKHHSSREMPSLRKHHSTKEDIIIETLFIKLFVLVQASDAYDTKIKDSKFGTWDQEDLNQTFPNSLCRDQKTKSDTVFGTFCTGTQVYTVEEMNVC